MSSGILSASASSRIAVFNALCKLLDEKSLDDISARELCEQAEVGKSTFYTYFQDKYDVLLWYSDLAHEVGVGQIGRTMTWEEGHRITTEAILAEADALNRGAESHDINSINPHSARWREDSIILTLTKYRDVRLTEKLRYQIAALATGEITIAQRYFKAEKRMPLDDYIDTMISIVPSDLYRLLEKPLCLPDQTEENKRRMLELTILQMQRH